MNLNTESLLRKDDTIVALSTPSGVGAIAVIRVSGKNTLSIVNQVFKGKDLTKQVGHTLHFGSIKTEQGEILDEVVLGLFLAPHSFTKEDVVEISCHGSDYIIQKIIELLLSKGARLALAGEFTQRAYLNGRMDLAQAEAIADLIASDSQASHQLAMQQMRGGYSQKIKDLRENFIRLAALLELELDFAEEDVEFADRSQLKNQVFALKKALTEIADSFALGNAIKNGVPIAIVGKPNAGKSTLLNALLQEEKAIVSAIPGTTRDAIEDEKIIQGIRFRFIDTAGLRETQDEIESIGIERTKQKIRQASLILYLFDLQAISLYELNEAIKEIETYQIPYLLIGNKSDEVSEETLTKFKTLSKFPSISAKEKKNLAQLEEAILNQINLQPLRQNQVIVSNLRHYQSLKDALKSLAQVEKSMDLNLGTELIASDIREAIYHLGSITGEISNNDLLEFIFSKFCIGK